MFPGTPESETQTVVGGQGEKFKIQIHKLKALAEYSVIYADYSIPVDDPKIANAVLDNGVKGAVAEVNSELLSVTEISIDGNPGRLLKEKMPDGSILRAKMYLVGKRLYQIAITTPREEGVSSELVAFYASTANKFLDSFKLIPDKKAP